MTDSFTRRRLLSLLLIAIGPLPGCFAVDDSYAGLSMDLRNVVEKNGGYEVTMNAQVGVGADWEPFRNVSVVGKSEDGTVVCRTFLGDLTRAGDYEPVSFTCEAFPHTITYEIDRDPCGPDTTVQKMVYDDAQNDWVPEDIEC